MITKVDQQCRLEKKGGGQSGDRVIILQAGWVQGWIRNSSALVFREKKGGEDYHGEMNTQHSMDWFRNRLIVNRPPKSVIVLDNAKYHNAVVERVPTKRR